MSHLFWYCPVTFGIIKHVTLYYFGIEFGKSEWFSMDFNLTSIEYLALGTILNVISYVIWVNKLQKRAPNGNLIVSEVNFNLGYVIGCNQKLKPVLENLSNTLRNKRRG